VASSEESPVAMKLKKMWLKAPVSEDGDTNLGKCSLSKAGVGNLLNVCSYLSIKITPATARQNFQYYWKYQNVYRYKALRAHSPCVVKHNHNTADPGMSHKYKEKIKASRTVLVLHK
jgi:hypothetical protein